MYRNFILLFLLIGSHDSHTISIISSVGYAATASLIAYGSIDRDKRYPVAGITIFLLSSLNNLHKVMAYKNGFKEIDESYAKVKVHQDRQGEENYLETIERATA